MNILCSPVILYVLQQFSELSGLDCEECQHAREEEEERIYPPLQAHQGGGRGDDGRGEAVREKVGHRQGQSQGLH